VPVVLIKGLELKGQNVLQAIIEEKFHNLKEMERCFDENY